MQELKLADDLFEELRGFKKYATVRAGRREILPGPMRFVSVSGAEQFEVEVKRVSYTRLADLTDTDAYWEFHDPDANAEDLQISLLRFYPELKPDDLVTLVTFTY